MKALRKWLSLIAMFVAVSRYTCCRRCVVRAPLRRLTPASPDPTHQPGDAHCGPHALPQPLQLGMQHRGTP